jgi:hypothetical protein
MSGIEGCRPAGSPRRVQLMRWIGRDASEFLESFLAECPRWDRNMVGDNFCLDSNSAGTVYVNPCQRGNRYQKWEFWNGGWARNVATRRCLENPSFSFSAIRTRPCAHVPAQYWKNWRYGWFQRPAYASVSRPGCLGVNGRRVSVSLCGDPFHPILPVQWFTELA